MDCIALQAHISMDSQPEILEWVAFPPPRDLPDQKPNAFLLILHWQSFFTTCTGKPTVATPEVHFLLMILEKTDLTFLRKQEFFSAVPGLLDCIADQFRTLCVDFACAITLQIHWGVPGSGGGGGR